MIKVSVIITTKNEEKHIENCLRSVKEQSFIEEDIEIIVVDNRSTDKTKEIALKYTKNVFDLGPERSAQRNFGIKRAEGKYVLYLDADMILSKNVISECIEKSEKDDLAGLYIHEKIIGNGFWIKVRDFERSFYDATLIDCVRFIRRTTFEKVQGFDENLTGPEDWDFDRKIRNIGQTGLIKVPIYHNEGSFDLITYLSKKSYYSKNFERYIAKWGRDNHEIKKQLGFSYRFLGVFIEQGKWVRILKHPILTIAMYGLRFLVGVNYLLIKKGANN